MHFKKFLPYVACLILTLAVVSPVAFAAGFAPGDFVFVFCSGCKETKWQRIKSFERPTSTSRGSLTSTCNDCGTLNLSSPNFRGEAWKTGGIVYDGDVVSFKCSLTGKTELAFASNYVRPTCDTYGRVSFSHECGGSSSESIPSLGHSYQSVIAFNPTCTSFGTRNNICQRCGKLGSTSTIPALGHDWTETRTEPTCTAPGSSVKTCSRCQEQVMETLPALTHSWMESSRTDATCTLPGSVEYVCSRCAEKKKEARPALSHRWAVEQVIEPSYDKDGNVTAPGYTVYRCTNCGGSYRDNDNSGLPDGGGGMFDATAALGKTFLTGIWNLFGIYVPGFSFTIGQMWLGVLLASISILVVKMIFGFGGGYSGEGTRTSSTSRPKISRERRNDEL